MAKRLFDILFSLLGLTLVIPILILISVIIILEDGSPVFFKQIRIGKNRREFTLFKFRSMKTDVEGLKITTDKDPRITKSGNWLRKLKLDELPQLFNIMIGDMSFVGPRPEVKKYVDLYTSEQLKVLQVRPGLTGLDSLEYSNESELLNDKKDPEQYYINTIMPDKLRLGVEYTNIKSILLDCSIILKTIKKVFF